jgi:hypothetical protein
MTDLMTSIKAAAIQMFSPVYVFHPKERYFPLLFPTYVRGCSLVKRGSSPKVLVEFPNLTVEDLTDGELDPCLEISAGPTKDVYLKIDDPRVAYGSSPFQPYSADTPRAVHYVYPTVVQVERTMYLDLLFNLLYGYNCMAGDDHPFDSEYVIVRVRVGDVAPDAAEDTVPPMSLAGMWTSRHGGGGWYTPNDLQIWHGTHPVSFVALGSHANYISPGIQRRLWGFGNDICAKQVGSGSRVALDVFDPEAVVLTKPGDAAFPGADTAEYRYMAYVGQTSGAGGQLMAWNPRYLNTIQTPPQKASDDTSQFVRKEVPGIGSLTFWGVVCLLLLVILLQVMVFTRNVQSIRDATWQQTLIVTFSFVAGVFATYASLLRGGDILAPARDLNYCLLER